MRLNLFGNAPRAGRAYAPLARRGGARIRDSLHANPHATWAARSHADNAADRALACHRIWNELPEIGIHPKFRFHADDKVFALGSCFAREVEDALTALGFDVPTYCDALFEGPLLAPAPGGAMRPRSFLNRYNAMSLADEVAHLIGKDRALEEGLLTYEIDHHGCADLHYSQALPQRGKSVALGRRKVVREYLGPRLKQCRVFVVTLGMAESWYDSEAGRYLNNTPGPRVMAAFADRLEVRLTRFEEQLAALERVHALLSEARAGDFRLIVTVSPVPLERTFLEQDVVTTNCYSKSMLRAVAEEFSLAHDDVDYFPSFEFVTHANASTAWAWDFRHVKPALVAHIMQAFGKHYVEEH